MRLFYLILPLVACNEVVLSSCVKAIADVGLKSCSSDAYKNSLWRCLSDHDDDPSADFEAQCGFKMSQPETVTKWADYYNSMTNGTGKPSKSAVLVPSGVYDSWFDAYSHYYENRDQSRIFGYSILGFWALVLLIATLNRAVCAAGVSLKLYGRSSRFVRSNITLPTTFKNLSLGYPNRLDSIIVSLYYALVIVLLCIQWRHVSPPKSFSTIYFSMFGIRAGVISLAHLPLIFLFGGRNNITAFVTGISFKKYVRFHKATGRVMALLALVHGACIIHVKVNQHVFQTFIRNDFAIFGLTAVCSLVLIVALSFKWVARNSYEVFLYTHIILAAIFIVGAWRHTRQVGLIEFVYASVAVWAVERIVRVSRILRFGLFPEVEYSLVDEDLLKVSMPKPSWMDQPGKHCYLYFGLGLGLIQSHPFTVCTSRNNPDSMSFYIRKKKGITSKVFTQVQEGKKPRVLVEGYYGASKKLVHNNCVFIGAGNGVVGPFSHAAAIPRDIVESNKRVKLLWINKDIESIRWLEKDLEELSSMANVDVTVYLTRQREPKETHKEDQEKHVSSASTDVDEEEEGDNKAGKEEAKEIQVNEKEELESVKTLNSSFEIVYGRPATKDLIDLESCTGSVCVMTCGPQVLCNDIRNEVAKQVSSYHRGRLDYFEELQTW